MLEVTKKTEVTENIITDCPTVRRTNINLLLMIAAKYGWKICSHDITSAFLQSASIEREVFVKAPLERRIPGVVWK